MNSNGNPQMSRMDESSTANAAENMLDGVKFEYDGKLFSRKISDEMYNAQTDIEEMEKKMTAMGDQADMFKNMTYTLKYNFPHKINLFQIKMQ